MSFGEQVRAPATRPAQRRSAGSSRSSTPAR
jgi:hypothetical protein